MTLPTFNDASLLHRALIHRSYLNEHPDEGEDNERLEFLGDAVVDFVAGSFVYHRYPEMTEGQLTRLRAAIVRTDQLAAFAAELNIGALVLVGRGEEEGGGRQRAPLLCATFEAVVGAYYLDAGIDAVRAFLEPLFLWAAQQILRNETMLDAKSLLQEWSQSALGTTPRYRTVSAIGPDHSKVFTVEVHIRERVYGTGTGPNKQAAAQSAAEAALRNLDQE